MIQKYNNYLNENKGNDNIYDIYCEINESYLLEITGQNNIDKAISNELDNINSFKVTNIKKLESNHFILSIELNDNIHKNTETTNNEESIQIEFNWLDQSGIRIEKIMKP